MIDYKRLANELIDSMIQVSGLWETIEFLLDFHISKEQLIQELNFDRNDVEQVMKTNKK